MAREMLARDESGRPRHARVFPGGGARVVSSEVGEAPVDGAKSTEGQWRCTYRVQAAEPTLVWGASKRQRIGAGGDDGHRVLSVRQLTGCQRRAPGAKSSTMNGPRGLTSESPRRRC